MATNFLWAGAGAYLSGPTNLLTTQLNALASGSLTVAGTAIQNTGGYIYADVEFVAGGAYSPTAGAYVELWLLRSIDSGTNYEDGGTGVAPGRPADIVIPVRNGTTITPRAGASGLIVPPGFFKPLARQNTGATLPSTSNLIRYSLYTEQY
jgi:hypothetical protein